VTELAALGEVKLAASMLPEAQDVEASERLRLLLVRLREPPVMPKSTDLVPAPAVAPADGEERDGDDDDSPASGAGTGLPPAAAAATEEGDPEAPGAAAEAPVGEPRGEEANSMLGPKLRS